VVNNHKKNKEHKEKYCDMNPKTKYYDKKGVEKAKLIGVHGWLKFFVITFIFGSILGILDLFTPKSYEDLFTPTSNESLIYPLIITIVFIVIITYLLILIFKKDKKFPKYILLFLWVLFFLNIISFLWAGEVGARTYGEIVAGGPKVIIPLIIWIIYFTISKRVERTFTK